MGQVIAVVPRKFFQVSNFVDELLILLMRLLFQALVDHDLVVQLLDLFLLLAYHFFKLLIFLG